MDFAPVEQNIDRPRTISMTRMAMLDSCPRGFYLDFLYNGGIQSHAMARGTIFHGAVEDATNLMLDGGEVVSGDVVRGIAQNMLNETDLVVPAHEQDVIRGMAWNWGERHARWIDLSTLVCNERLLAIEIEGWTIRGRIDRAHVNRDEGWCIIVDYKTGLHIPTNEALKRDFQLRLYALLMTEGRTVDREGNVLDDKPPAAGCNVFWPTLAFPRLVGDNDIVTRSPMENGMLVPIKREDLYDLKQALAALLRKVERGLETGIWPATDGPHCSKCAAPSACPIPRELRDFEVIETPEQAAEMLSIHNRVKAEQKRRLKAIKAFADGRDIELEGGSWGLRCINTDPPSTRLQEVA